MAFFDFASETDGEALTRKFGRSAIMLLVIMFAMTIESRDQVRRYFDAFGDAEWDRLTGDVAGRVSLEVHRRFLARFVRPGQRVLEVGAGPGRFTAELAGLGASVVVTDLSPVQLALNEERLRRGRGLGGRWHPHPVRLRRSEG
ncbi:hypothetical protein GCM10022419_022350 [Nonomuraea rosea]|uniref:Methyltransferase domain-containing protein n=1 Tax=Nonomuraea rosea TaxID=638574 RepID=A0ABP6VVB8_9ACTN